MRSVEQLEFRPPLPVVMGNADYRQYEERLLRMDDLLWQSGLVTAFVERCVAKLFRQIQEKADRTGKRFHEPSAKQLACYEQMCRQAVRCNLARQWVGKEFRTFSLRNATLSACKPTGRRRRIRMKQVLGCCPDSVGGDRGFASKGSHRWLESDGIHDANCPRDPRELTERMKDKKFRDIQKRRAQTEARIGIVKNACLWLVCDTCAQLFVKRPCACPPAPRPPPTNKQKWEFWDRLYGAARRFGYDATS